MKNWLREKNIGIKLYIKLISIYIDININEKETIGINHISFKKCCDIIIPTYLINNKVQTKCWFDFHQNIVSHSKFKTSYSQETPNVTFMSDNVIYGKLPWEVVVLCINIVKIEINVRIISSSNKKSSFESSSLVTYFVERNDEKRDEP